MRFPVPARRFDESRPEMVDMPDADPLLLADEMCSIAAINRRFGGVSALQKALLPMILKTDSSCAVEILDLATGSGDQPCELVRSLRRLGRRAIITAVDRNEHVLHMARQHAGNDPDIHFEHGDVRALDYPDRRFDFVMCSLALHHFSRPDAAKVLGEMDRLSRRGFVVNDLSRGFPAAFSAWLYTRLTTTNIMTRYDAVASCFAAFTADELFSLAQEAGISGLQVYSTPMFRLVATKEHPSPVS
jgi:ubiquinone/menaquinone biosynthesis C-methylase UbiE